MAVSMDMQFMDGLLSNFDRDIFRLAPSWLFSINAYGNARSLYIIDASPRA